jgi:hypothetical protein
MYCRRAFTMQSKTTYFEPHKLSDTDLANTQLKRGLLGAALRGHFSKLPKDAFKVVFETQLMESHPAHMRPTKVKMYMLGKTTLMAGKYYKIS